MMEKTCVKCGYVGLDFYSRRRECKKCARQYQRNKTKEDQNSGKRQQWLDATREQRRKLKEADRRKKGIKTINEIKAAANEKKLAAKNNIELQKQIKESLHDSHVKTMRSLSKAARFRWRYKTDPEFNAKERIRTQLKKLSEKYPKLGDLMRDAIERNGKSNQVEAVCGYTMERLKEHLNRQFTKGMTWEMFIAGHIHIDHIIPKSSFDLHDDEEIRRCWCLSNLRPIWKEQNMEKSNKRVCLI